MGIVFQNIYNSRTTLCQSRNESVYCLKDVFLGITDKACKIKKLLLKIIKTSLVCDTTPLDGL